MRTGTSSGSFKTTATIGRSGESLGDSGKKVYNRIVRKLEGGLAVEFVLVDRNKGAPGQPEPFYIMKHKVTNDVFSRFAAAEPESGAGGWDAWRQGLKWIDEQRTADENPRLPVFAVTVDEAERCAKWLGGRLPTARQWDQAAGKSRGAVGPYSANVEAWDQTREPPEFALVNTGPIPVGVATSDVSLFGCRDMAANGFEWTRSLYLEVEPDVPQDVDVPFDDATAKVLVERRAMGFRQYPFRFDHDVENQIGRFERAAETSFRIVIEFTVP